MKPVIILLVKDWLFQGTQRFTTMPIRPYSWTIRWDCSVLSIISRYIIKIYFIIVIPSCAFRYPEVFSSAGFTTKISLRPSPYTWTLFGKPDISEAPYYAGLLVLLLLPLSALQGCSVCSKAAVRSNYCTSAYPIMCLKQPYLPEGTKKNVSPTSYSV